MRAAVMDRQADSLVLQATIGNWKLPSVVLLFGAYAVLDGVLAIGAAGRVGVLDAWPVALEGAVSVGIGVWASLSLALLLFVLPYGDATGIVYFIGSYAVLFGVFLALGARVMSRAHGR